MKKLILFLIIIFPFVSKAQTEAAQSKPHEQYCMVVATPKMLSNKVTITVDFGQETKFFSLKDQSLKDSEGKPIVFNSAVDALNYMSTQGWFFVNAYTLQVSGANVMYYVLRRPVAS
jgi:hypothetical protein